MRLSCRLFAQAKAIRTIEPYAPTGLTGLTTHPSPRSTLIFLYSSTLEKLKVLPEQSVYRQSAEAITRNRLKIVESIAPAGLEEWTLQASQLLKETPEAFQLAKGRNGETRKFHNINGETFMESRSAAEPDDQNDEWEEESIELLKLENLKRLGQRTDLTPEPQLDANQISDLESQIGAGLIEEVIQVAEGEMKLIELINNSLSWEELQDKAPPGQWEYHDRLSVSGAA